MIAIRVSSYRDLRWRRLSWALLSDRMQDVLTRVHGRAWKTFRHTSAAKARRRPTSRSHAVSRVVALAVALSPHARIAAQEVGVTPAGTLVDSSPAKKVCFRGQPTCSWFFITEAGIGFRLNPDPIDPNPSGRLLTGALGWRRRQDQRDAGGPTAFQACGASAA